eukprot:m.324411 g.324411  ORF g.324411 m.324411 type:complete len:1017 (+) comp16462_c0_seq3:3281-6331(+)
MPNAPVPCKPSLPGLSTFFEDTLRVGLRLFDALVACPQPMNTPTFVQMVALVLSDPIARLSGLAQLKDVLKDLETPDKLVRSPWFANSHELSSEFVVPRGGFGSVEWSRARTWEIRIAELAEHRGHLEAAYSYFDMIELGLAVGLSGICACFLQSCRHLLQQQRACKRNLPQCYGIRVLIRDLLMTASSLASRGSWALSMQVNRVAAGILAHSMVDAPTGSVSSDDMEALQHMARGIVFSSFFGPFFSQPFGHASDVVMHDLLYRTMTEAAQRKLGEATRLAGLASRSAWACGNVQGVWHGWISRPAADVPQDEDEDFVKRKAEADFHDAFDAVDVEPNTMELGASVIAVRKRIDYRDLEAAVAAAELARQHRVRKRDADFFDAVRRDAINEILHDSELPAEAVALCIDGMRLPRTKDGFLMDKPPPQHPSHEFSGIDGFRIEKRTGAIHLRLRPASKHQPGLFGWSDIREAFESPTGGQAVFSLDEIDPDLRSNPFQLMHFAPSSLRDTGMLAALFHADYLMKFFSVGVEVSALPPFDLRPAHDGLLKRLPKHLADAVSVCAEATEQRKPRAHRFWIQAGEMGFDLDETDDAMVCNVGELAMSVQQQVMRRNPATGEMEDDVAEAHEDSPEKTFAANMTKHYVELGQYFPVFLRIRELGKLGFLAKILHEVSDQASKQLDDLRPKLREVQASASPNPSYSVVEGHVDDLLREQGLQKHTVGNLDEVRSSIRKQYREAYYQQVKPMVDKISAKVRETETLVASARKLGLDRTPPKDSTGLQTGPTSTDVKGWVPAVYHLSDSRGGMRVYGGVNMSPRAQQQVVTPPSTSTYVNSATALNAQRGNALPYSNAVRMDNLRAFNNAQAAQAAGAGGGARPPNGGSFFGGQAYFNHGLFGKQNHQCPGGIAGTFGGSGPHLVLTQNWTEVRRYHGGTAGPNGWYWTRDTYSNPAAARSGLAVLSKWGNTMENVSTRQIPPGTRVWVGQAAPQAWQPGPRLFNPVREQFAGGGDQVVWPQK